MSVILGLNSFHPDASACLVVDGDLVAAVAEERLGPRNKHTMSFPVQSIAWVLDYAGLKLQDVTQVAVARDPKANLLSKVVYSTKNLLNGPLMISGFLSRQRSMGVTLSNLANSLGENQSGCNFEVVNIEHHLAHLSSSYFVSDFDTAVGFSYDGSGDFVSAMHAVCEGHNITIKNKVTLPHSLGHFYSALCQFIGFDQFGEEYKVMGLAPYGEDAYKSEMHEILKLPSNKWFQLNEDYFNIYKGMSEAELKDDGAMRLGSLYSPELCNLLGNARVRGEELTQREKDLAKSTQVHFERAALQSLQAINQVNPIKNLVMAGGCALNGVMNAKIYRDTPVQKMYLQCASSDDGTAIGAAYACWHMKLGNSKRFHMKHAFWGPEYSDHEIEQAIIDAGYSVGKLKDADQTVEVAARLIEAGNVVGWYQGRSEWGPRALGNRSILANPLIPSMKDIINKKIKKRESFRPFAPSVLREEVSRFFEQDIDSPFMMHVVKFKTEFLGKFPAVTHIDGTGRLQTVDRDNNALYYKLIKEFKKLTGYGILLNTSFNENEPIVDTPAQAVACFKRTDMDVLVMGDYIVTKSGLAIDVTSFVN
jgi:carbamoyltransferase